MRDGRPLRSGRLLADVVLSEALAIGLAGRLRALGRHLAALVVGRIAVAVRTIRPGFSVGLHDVWVPGAWPSKRHSIASGDLAGQDVLTG
jgi:hypothetical protein